MAIVLQADDPVVYWLALGQPYAAKVVTTNGADPPVLTLAVGNQQYKAVRYNANGQSPNTWCQYSDPGRPGTLPDPDHVVTPVVYQTQEQADARYLTQAQADDLYAAIDHEHA